MDTLLLERITFSLAVHPNMPKSGQIVFSLNYAFLQTLSNRSVPNHTHHFLS